MGFFDFLDPKNMLPSGLSGGGSSGGGGDMPSIVPVGQPQDINAEGDANRMDPTKAYGFKNAKGLGNTTFDEQRQRQMGAGREG